MANIEDCLPELKKAFPDADEDLIKAIAVKVSEFKGLPKSASLKELRKQLPEMQSYLKRNSNLNRLATKKANDMLRAEISRGDKFNPQRSIKAVFVGEEATFKNSKDSYSAHREGASNRHRVNMSAFAGNTGRELLMNDKNTKQILSMAADIRKGKSVPSGDFKDAAQALIKFNKYIVAELEKSGAFINDRADYLMRQIHDGAKIDEAGFDRWFEFTYGEGRLDNAKMFTEGTTAAEHKDILREMFEDITATDHVSQGAHTLGRARKIHFREGGVAAAEYHNEFGEGSIWDVMNRTANGAAKVEASFTKFGPQGADAVMKKMEKIARNHFKSIGDKDALKKFNDNNRLIGAQWKRNQFLNVVRGYDNPASSGHSTRIINVLKGVKTFQVLKSLQGAFLATVGDFPLSSMDFAARTGYGPISSYLGSLRSYVKTLTNPSDRRELARFMLISEDWDRHRISGDDISGVRNWSNRFTKASMVFNLLDATTTLNRGTATRFYSLILGKNKGKAFKDLDPRLQGSFESFGINAKMWEDAQKVMVDFKGGGSMFNLDELPQSIKKSFHHHALSFSRSGAISPTDATKAFMNLGENPEGVTGQTISTVLQFKSFAFEFARKMREIAKSNPAADNSTFASAVFGNKDNAAILGTGVAALTALGLFRNWGREILIRGETPSDLDGKAVFEAFVANALPLSAQFVGDIAVNKLNGISFGRDPLRSFAGPTVGDILDTIDVLATGGTNALQEDRELGDKGAESKAVRLFRRNILGVLPLANGPFIAPLINHYWYDDRMEEASPGYKARKDRRLERQGQEEIVPLLLDKLDR